MEYLLNGSAWLGALGIFALRVVDMTFDTLRLLFVVRGRKGLAWFLGFCQSLIFVIAITAVLNNLDNPLNLVGYAAGFATGNVAGMWIEERLAVGHVQVQIISSGRGAVLAQKLRASGFAVTEIPARGRDGMVSLLTCSLRRREVAAVREILKAEDPEAFITQEDVSPVRRGFWRA